MSEVPLALIGGSMTPDEQDTLLSQAYDKLRDCREVLQENGLLDIDADWRRDLDSLLASLFQALSD